VNIFPAAYIDDNCTSHGLERRSNPSYMRDKEPGKEFVDILPAVPVEVIATVGSLRGVE